MATAYDFVLTDWTDMNWSERPQPGTVEELAPYWEEMMEQCRENDREIPEDLTIELYVSIWNDMCKKED